MEHAVKTNETKVQTIKETEWQGRDMVASEERLEKNNHGWTSF